jgi:hypothetical protein
MIGAVYCNLAADQTFKFQWFAPPPSDPLLCKDGLAIRNSATSDDFYDFQSVARP